MENFDVLILNKLDLVMNEIMELRLLVDNLTNKSEMWKEASQEGDLLNITCTITDKSNEDLDLKRLNKYVDLEKAVLSPFENEVVKLMVASEPLDFICSQLSTTEKAVKLALDSALNKAIREEELNKANSVMDLFLVTNEPLKKVDITSVG